jgi:hypothetical protein
MRVHYWLSVVVVAVLLVGLPAFSFGQGACAVPVLYTGYFFHDNGAEFSISSPDSANSLTYLRHKYNLEGIWLETIVPIRGSCPLGMAVGGAFLFPFDKHSNETLVSSTGQAVERTWRADTQWWNLQLLLTYDFYPGIAGVAGFRYDSFQVNFRNPSTEVFGGTTFEDSSNLTINTYIPFLGVAVAQTLPRMGLNAEVGVIVFPTVLGSVDFVETGQFTVQGQVVQGIPVSGGFENGFFLEGFAEATVPLGYGVRTGGFVKYSTIQAEAKVNIGERHANIPNVVYDTDFTRKTWVVGGFASLDF